MKAVIDFMVKFLAGVLPALHVRAGKAGVSGPYQIRGYQSTGGLDYLKAACFGYSHLKRVSLILVGFSSQFSPD